MDYKSRTKVSRILIDEAVPVGTNVIILGWVRTVRSSKEVAFIEINDGSSHEEYSGRRPAIRNRSLFSEHILTGASVRLEGYAGAVGGKGQKYEIAVSRIDLVGGADASYPLQKKRHTMEFLREIAHLRPRTNTLRRREPHPLQDGVRRPYLFSGARFLLHPHADHFCVGLRRRGESVSRLDSRFEQHSQKRTGGSTGIPTSLPPNHS